MRYRLSRNFASLNELKFHGKLNQIGTSVTGNQYFAAQWPAPFISNDALNAMIKAYNAIYSEAEKGASDVIAQRNKLRIELTTVLQNLAGYFETVADNNLAALQSTGYDLNHEPVASQNHDAPAAPDSITFKRGPDGGTAIVHAASDDSVKQWEAEVTLGDPAVEANWGGTLKTEHCNRIVFRGLVPGKTYHARLRAWNKNGWSAWTISTSLMVV